ncbi:proteasome maturation protein [Aplysia californica]|uniref:Proteasome maturation protein n=1 Tax=Aplysia californica TaxID=6500 RepID=A0ABM1AET0_APLCA|nr:proteasome maturation protein [Aplysia californica]
MFSLLYFRRKHYNRKNFSVYCVFQDLDKLSTLQAFEMSGYPTLRPQPVSTKVVNLPNGPYGVPDAMLNGFQVSRASAGLQSTHPLESSEEQWHDHKFRMDCAMLKNSQGAQAPLKMHMERFVVSQVSRLPGLQSSNIMLDTLTGREDSIGFEDFLNNPADSEVMGQPHILMEKRLGLL